MTKTTRARLVTSTSIVFAFLVANVLADVLHASSFRDVRTSAVALLVCALLAAGFRAMAARVSHVPAGRSAAVAAISASLAAFLLLRFPSPWVDLGPFGAGPLTAIAIVVLPAAQVAAIACARRWISREASRTPPSSRQP